MKRWDERLHMEDLQLHRRWLRGTLLFAMKVVFEQTKEVGWLILNRSPYSRESRISEADLKSSDQEVTVLIDDIEMVNPP